jgi:CheY-like chemotaxis protein
MSHEIRTPMNAVIGYAQLLGRERGLEPEQRKKVDAILSSGDHLLAVVNNVLEMSRIEAGRITLVKESFDLATVLQGSQRMFAGLARQRGLALVFDLAPDLPSALTADSGKVRQVVANLVGNALKFTTAGKIRVAAKSTPAERGEVRVSIDVSDTGTGIAAEDHERIFETFEQTAHGERAGGTGLGLAISRQFARLMGGDLVVTSELGVGSTFQFTFRAQPAKSTGASGEYAVGLAPVSDPNRARPKVLAVDDVAENRDVVLQLLSGLGFEVRTADTAAQGLALHDSWSPDLVLMDLSLPDMDGLQAIATLRQRGSGAAIIAMTASAMGESKNLALAAGANDFMSKPFRDDDLLKRIADLLRIQYARRPESSPPSSSHPGHFPAALLAPVPPSLLAQLRDAALGARMARIEELCTEIAHYSTPAVERIRALCSDFRYDALALVVSDALNEQANAGN